jgi:hypothetical protein
MTGRVRALQSELAKIPYAFFGAVPVDEPFFDIGFMTLDPQVKDPTTVACGTTGAAANQSSISTVA